MKRQIQESGERKWYGNDHIIMQNELWTAIESFFEPYGCAILKGCQINIDTDKWTVGAGVVGLYAPDKSEYRVCKFQEISLPVSTPVAYLSLQSREETEEYLTGGVKPILKEYYAEVSATAPSSGEYLAIKKNGNNTNFRKAFQDATARMVTDAQIQNWTSKEPAINKKSGFNLDKSDSTSLGSSDVLATSKAVSALAASLQGGASSSVNTLKKLYDWAVGQLNGKAPKSHASTSTEYGVATSANYGHVKASSTPPRVAGAVSVGADNGMYAREGHVHPAQTNVTGNAGTATKLANINTTFSGEYPMVVNVNGLLYSHEGMKLNGTTKAITATSFIGNAATATKLATSRTLTIGNTGKTFNGSANLSWNASEMGVRPWKSTTLNLTGYSTSNWIGVYFNQGTSEISQRLNFVINGGSGSASSSYTQTFLRGYAQSSGWSALRDGFELSYYPFDTHKSCIHSIWRGTQNMTGIVIYLRGGFNYSVRHDANTLSVLASNTTIGNAVFPSNMSDIVSGGSNRSRMITLIGSALGTYFSSLQSKAIPKSHASTNDTYGPATSVNYGHTRLSDSITSTSNASGGYAASPKAVNDARLNAVTSVQGGASSGVNTLKKLYDWAVGQLNGKEPKITKKSGFNLDKSDSITSSSSSTLATSSAVRTVLDIAIEKEDKQVVKEFKLGMMYRESDLGCLYVITKPDLHLDFPFNSKIEDLAPGTKILDVLNISSSSVPVSADWYSLYGASYIESYYRVTIVKGCSAEDIIVLCQ